jgi:hypothetical protein
MGWKETLSAVAPVLGAALGGPVGGVASKFIADKLLGKPDADIEEIEQAILTSSPEQLSKLKELDNQFKVEMKKLNIDIFALEVEDRGSARQLFKVDKTPQMALSGLFIIGYFVILGLLLSGSIAISEQLEAPIMLLIGLITREVPTIMQFWFGSSSGSKDKNKYDIGVK